VGRRRGLAPLSAAKPLIPTAVYAKRDSSLRAQRSNLVNSRPRRLQIAASPGGLLAMTGAGRDVHEKFEPVRWDPPFCLRHGAVDPPAASWAQQRPPIAEQMAKTYGLDSFEQID